MLRRIPILALSGKYPIFQLNFFKYRPSTYEQNYFLRSCRDGNLQNIIKQSHLAKFDIRNIAGNTPLHLAIIGAKNSDNKNYVDIIKILCENGANLNAKNDYGHTPFDEVCSLVDPSGLEVEEGSFFRKVNKFTKINEIFTKHGFNINGTRDISKSYLGKLAFSGAHYAIEDLCKKGADVNIRDQFGCTPLHYVSIHGHNFLQQWRAADVLLAEGANPFIANKEGKTPLDLALSQNGNKHVANYSLLPIFEKNNTLRMRSHL